MKNAASAGLRIVCLSVPHRGDDPIRNNHDLAGRFFSVTFEFWSDDELAEIERALPQSVDLLRRGGRLAVISFHSLEDRLVKNFLRAQQEAGLLSILTKKPLTATAEEASANPRSRSAKLRIAVRE